MIEILQVRSEAYSSWSEKNVNDSDHGTVAITEFVRLKNVDSKANCLKALMGKGYRSAGLWKS
jgi:hypothetical protein